MPSRAALDKWAVEELNLPFNNPDGSGLHDPTPPSPAPDPAADDSHPAPPPAAEGRPKKGSKK